MSNMSIKKGKSHRQLTALLAAGVMVFESLFSMQVPAGEVMESTGVFAAEDLTTEVSIEEGLTAGNFADEELFEDIYTGEEPLVEDVYAGEEPLLKDRYTDGEPFIEDTDAGEEPLVEDIYAGEESPAEGTYAGVEPLTEDTYAGEEPLAEDAYVDEETLTEDAYAGDEAITDDAYADDEVLSEEACTEEEPLLSEEYAEEDLLAAFEEEGYPSDEGTCGENLTWRLEGGVLTISGTGAMADYEPEDLWGQVVGSTAPWNEYKYGKGVSRVIIEEGVTSIGDYAFVIFDDAEFELADSIERIGQYGLYRAGFETVKLPEHLTEIGPLALADNTNLLELSIPEGVTKLSRGLFWWTSLRRISLPASLTEIEYAAFQYADLTFVDYGGTRADWEQLIIGEENAVLENAVIHFTDDAPAVLSGSCGKRVVWVLDEEGTLTVGGQGPMDDYEMTRVPGGSIRDGYCDGDRVNSPWWGVCNKVKKIEIQEGVTSIGDNAFYNLYHAQSTSIPYSVISIGDNAFRSTDLREIFLPDSVERIGEGCFECCKRLSSVRLSNSLAELPYACFDYVGDNLTLQVPHGVTRIDNAIGSGVTRLFLPSTLTTFREYPDSKLEIHLAGDVPSGTSSGFMTGSNYNSSGENFTLKGVYCTERYYKNYKDKWIEWAEGNLPSESYFLRSLYTEGFFCELDYKQLTLSEENPSAVLHLTGLGETSGAAVTWKSTDSLVASVDQDGNVTAGGKVGKAYVYAQVKSGNGRGIVFCSVESVDSSRDPKLLSSLPTHSLLPNRIATSSIATQSAASGIIAYSPSQYIETDPDNPYYLELKALTENLTAGCQTDEEKALAITGWTADNLTYSMASLCMGETPDQAYAVYYNREGNCQGYSKLAGYMMSLAGLVSGIVTNDGHMWNIVLIDGQWRMIEPQTGWFVDTGTAAGYSHSDLEMVIFTQGDMTFIVNEPGDVKLAGVGQSQLNRTGITQLDIPDFVTTIFGDAAKNCTDLAGVTIPDSVKKICSGAFSGCTSLHEITIPQSVTKIDSSAFDKDADLTIKGYAGTAAQSYAAANGFAFINLGQGGGEGETETEDESETEAESETEEDTDIPETKEWEYTLNEDGITLNTYNGSDTELHIPESVDGYTVTAIGNRLFYGRSDLTGQICIPSSVRSIGNYAFYNCSGLTGSLVIPDPVVRIGKYAFYSCGELDGQLVLPKNLKQIGANAFAYCRKLQGELDLPASLGSVGESAFHYCASLTGNLVIPDRITAIPYAAFEGCSGLTSITFPDSLLEIDSWAFYNCSGLTGVITIPEGVSLIGSYAFARCTGVADIYLPMSLEQIDSSAFPASKCPLLHAYEGSYALNYAQEANLPFTVRPEFDDPVFNWAEDGSSCGVTVKCNPDPDRSITAQAAVTKKAGRPASCSQKGTTIYTAVYGEFTDELELQDIPVDPQAHTYGEWKVTKEVTCTESGMKEKTCSLCEDFVTEVIPATGHVWEEEYTVDKPAACTENGSKSIHCAVCDEIDETSVTEISMTGHAYGEWKVTKEAACTETGSKEKVCGSCGDIVTEVIPATGHVWEKEYTVDKPAACTENGLKSIHCAACDEIDETSVTEIPKTGHAYGEWKVTKEAACTEAGLKEKVCGSCGDTVTEVIPATGHVWEKEYTVDKPAACTENGLKSIHCAVCDEIDNTSVTEISMTGHAYGEWKVTKEAACTETGSKEKVCGSCGDIVTEVIPAAGHVWEEAYTVDKPASCISEGIRSIHCMVCDAIKENSAVTIEASGHDWGEPVYVWSGDNSLVAATCICRHDSAHKEVEIVNTTSEVTREATYQEEGQTTYTAVFINPVFSAQMKTKTNIPKLAKKGNTLAAKGRKITVKFSKLKKKNQIFESDKAFTIRGAQGKVTYKVKAYDKKARKKIKVSSSGKVTVKKGLGKGTYKLKVNVTAAGNDEYKALTKTVTLTVKVK